MTKKTQSAPPANGLIDPETLPYRSCVGIALINARGLVFVGNRIQTVDIGPLTWQLPQGGIDKGEDAHTAAFRELQEETGVVKTKAEIIGTIDDWLTYDLPPDLVGRALRGKYRGQTQRWFAMRFLGEDADIDIAADAHQEFSEWDWVPIRRIVDLVVPFKRKIYERVADAFEPLTQTARK